MNNQDEVLVVSSEDFSADPARYLQNVDEQPIRIISSTSKLTITVMGLAEPRPRGKTVRQLLADLGSEP